LKHQLRSHTNCNFAAKFIIMTQTKEVLKQLTHADAYSILMDGNKRFVQDEKSQRDLKAQVVETSDGQYPFAVVLSCIDSRVPVEIIFDQGIGDVFSVRVAGNIVNEDVLGSIEYACKVVGSKLVLVLGHTKCGAILSACKNVELGNITSLLKKIKPAVDIVKTEKAELDNKAIEEVAIQNVHLSIDRIRKESPVLSEMEKNGEIKIMGALYDVSTGVVEFFH